MINIIKNDVKIIFNEYINKKKELNSSYLELNLNFGIFPFFINNIKYVIDPIQDTNEVAKAIPECFK